MNDAELIDWLLDRGGPSVRYLTATQLVEKPLGADIEKLEAELLASEPVRIWLDRLERVRDIHGSSDLHLENVLGKLTSLGVRFGMQPFDLRIEPFRGTFAKPRDVLALLHSSILSAGLARAGCDDEDLCDFLCRRIDHLYQTASRGVFAIYLPRDTFDDYPEARQHLPLIDPRFYPEGRFDLPFIHDLHALASLPAPIRGSPTTRKINTIVNYVMHPDYQRLRDGYGTFRAASAHYCAMGWSAHLPAYDHFPPEGFDMMRLVQRLELMAGFSPVTRNFWFTRAIEHLEQFRTTAGTYRFPRQYLEDLHVGYWVNGARMALEPGRRGAAAIEIESTFRMLRIRKRITSAKRERAIV
jgi:hypothetical protein